MAVFVSAAIGALGGLAVTTLNVDPFASYLIGMAVGVCVVAVVAAERRFR